jgi:hypothetical protein
MNGAGREGDVASMNGARGRRRRAHRRGVAATENVVLISLVAIVVSTAIVAWGPPIVRSFSFTRTILVSPVP